MMLAVVLTATSVPNFEPVMGLMGGSTVTLTSLVFPCLFYLFLSASEQKSNEAVSEGDYNMNLAEKSVYDLTEVNSIGIKGYFLIYKKFLLFVKIQILLCFLLFLIYSM